MRDTKREGQLKIVIIDIETAPLESYTWGTFDQTVGLDQIKTEWSILSFAAKELGKRKVVYHCTGGRGKGRVRNDKSLLKALWKVLDDADLVIAQNGKKFDLKKINARMVMLGLKPYRPVKVLDTYEIAKRYFAFTSNRLAWMSKHLTNSPKSEHRQFPGMQLWLECLKDNPKAWTVMKRYNIRDVVATEKVYMVLRPWIQNHPNLSGCRVGTGVCPTCKSKNVRKNGNYYTSTSKVQRYRCRDCDASHCGAGQRLKRG